MPNETRPEHLESIGAKMFPLGQVNHARI